MTNIRDDIKEDTGRCMSGNKEYGVCSFEELMKMLGFDKSEYEKAICIDNRIFDIIAGSFKLPKDRSINDTLSLFKKVHKNKWEALSSFILFNALTILDEIERNEKNMVISIQVNDEKKEEKKKVSYIQ